MNKMYQAALACAIAALVAGCGADSTTSSQARSPAMAATVTSSQVSAQQGTHAVAEYYPVVQSVYVSYFGRPADPDGLQSFAEQLKALNAPLDLRELNIMANTDVRLQALLDSFNNSQESQDLYAGNNSVFIDAIYQNLFGRAPDAEGKAFWLDAVESGRLTRARASLNILSGAYNDPSSGDVAAINNRAAVSAMFTSGLNTGERLRAYRGQAAATTARNLLRGVNSATTPSSMQGDVDTAIAALLQAAPLSPQGMYHATLAGNGNTDINLLVLDDDTVYSFYGVQTASSYDVNGFTHASGASSNGSSISGSVMSDYRTETPANESFTFAYSAGSGLNGKIVTSTGDLNLNAARVASTTYDYNAAANMSDIVGAWTMTPRSGANATVTINANGTFAGSTTGCTFVGTIAPRPAKNVFDMTLSYGSGCAQAGQTTKGIGLVMKMGAAHELVLLGENSSRTTGTSYWGVR